MKDFRKFITACQTSDLHLSLPARASKAIDAWFGNFPSSNPVQSDLLTTTLRHIYGVMGNLQVDGSGFSLKPNGFNLMIGDTSMGEVDIRARTAHNHFYPNYVTIGTKEGDAHVVRYFELIERRDSNNQWNKNLFLDIVSKQQGSNCFIVHDWPQEITIADADREIVVSSENRKLTEYEELMQFETMALSGGIKMEFINFAGIIQRIYDMKLTQFEDIDILSEKNGQQSGFLRIKKGKFCREDFYENTEDSVGNSYVVTVKQEGNIKVEATRIAEGSAVPIEGRKIKDKYSDFVRELRQ